MYICISCRTLKQFVKVIRVYPQQQNQQRRLELKKRRGCAFINTSSYLKKKKKQNRLIGNDYQITYCIPDICHHVVMVVKQSQFG